MLSHSVEHHVYGVDVSLSSLLHAAPGQTVCLITYLGRVRVPQVKRRGQCWKYVVEEPRVNHDEPFFVIDDAGAWAGWEEYA